MKTIFNEGQISFVPENEAELRYLLKYSVKVESLKDARQTHWGKTSRRKYQKYTECPKCGKTVKGKIGLGRHMAIQHTHTITPMKRNEPQTEKVHSQSGVLAPSQTLS